jgi:hypothetical protein
VARAYSVRFAQHRRYYTVLWQMGGALHTALPQLPYYSTVQVQFAVTKSKQHATRSGRAVGFLVYVALVFKAPIHLQTVP